jgi:dTDP-4-amino-4,6-dideoxygalactose transaminase
MPSNSSIPFNDLSRTPPEVMRQIEAAIARVLASGWFVMGPEHNAFERELGEYFGVDHTVLLGNGTDALELALAAVGVGQGDSVLTVANAGAYASVAARLLGATPVYCDVSPDTLLMTADGVKGILAHSDEKPRAIVVTHLFGAMAPVQEIVAVAREYGVAVVEDCAQSIGATSNGQQSGTFGDIATTSFYPTKNLGALGDGGAVFTRSPELADSVRRMRQYGWDSKYHIAYDHGRNSRMDELQAAILRVKLPYLDAWNDRRREIHSRYEEAATGNAHLVNSSSESFTAHLAVLTSADRTADRESLKRAGIGTDVHYPIPDNMQDFPTNRPLFVSLPVTELAAQTVFSVPMFPELTDEEVDRICAALAALGARDE